MVSLSFILHLNNAATRPLPLRAPLPARAMPSPSPMPIASAAGEPPEGRPMTVSSSSSATSKVFMRLSSSGCTVGMPSSNIWMQNGQAVAMICAPVLVRLFGARDVDALALRLLDPHVRAAGAAAEAVLAVARHLDARAAGQRVDDVARAVVVAVVAAEVAGVVVGDRRAAGPCFGIERAVARASFARNVVWWMTSNLPSKCGYSFFIVLKQCGQLVMILRTPFALQHLDQRLRLRLVEVLVAEAARRVAACTSPPRPGSRS